ncbi:flavodoxin [Bifidobacterium samirii]|uniref:Flavodoxin n=1 Tax=Bifidobacterium samirii TaxID=2306974 RepID=A0A430FUU7_9BIFI|nr:flavodoxin [Bifidobacterium samirii]RSX57219.1 flavodoxin [Bifidobacterium samirii]
MTNESQQAVVVYFSRIGENYAVGEITEGNTAKVAHAIAEQVGASAIEIVPDRAYPDVYDAAIAQATRERNAAARPAFTLDGDAAALDTATTVFLGYPIWWADMPMPVYTFLESRDWRGVTIRPFCTHEGSGLADTAASIRDIAVGATVADGLELRGATAQHDAAAVAQVVTAWLNG